CALPIFRDHQPASQLVAEFRGQREPPLVVQLGGVGAEEHRPHLHLRPHPSPSDHHITPLRPTVNSERRSPRRKRKGKPLVSNGGGRWGTTRSRDDRTTRTVSTTSGREPRSTRLLPAFRPPYGARGAHAATRWGRVGRLPPTPSGGDARSCLTDWASRLGPPRGAGDDHGGGLVAERARSPEEQS